MVTVRDVVQAVANRGAAGFDELEEALAAEGEPFLQALDACVDHGYLRLVMRRDPFGGTPYRVTARGRRLLVAASKANAAA